MEILALPNGSTLVEYPITESSVSHDLAERIVVDRGAIVLDSANHSLDNSHLILDGTLTQGQDYFKITRAGEKLVNVDYNGILWAHQGVSSPGLTSLEVQVLANKALLDGATENNTDDALVKRNDSGTYFQHIISPVISVSQDVALYGDAAVTFTPQDAQGGNIAGWVYRFGANADSGGELGDYTGVSDGLEMKEPDDEKSNLTGNRLLIQVNPGTPTIEFLANKNPAIPWMLIRDGTEEKALSIDEEGIHVIPRLESSVLLTPGQHIDSNVLRPGYNIHRYELNSAWSNTISESSIELRGSNPQPPGTFYHVENIEVCLDHLSSTGSIPDIASRIYIKRWGVYRNVHSRLYVVLGVDFLNNETSIAQYSKVRLSFNFKTILEP